MSVCGIFGLAVTRSRAVLAEAVLSRIRSWLGREEPRPVLVHAHMFKNAGTTFDWSLRRSFGEAFLDHRDDDAMKQGAAYFGPWLQENSWCSAVSSHWVTAPMPQLDDLAISLCLMLRDPVERMRSVYQFERQQEGVDTPGSIRAKQMSFAEYMEWQMQPMPGPVVKNYQVRYCSGDYLGDDLPGMYSMAQRLVQSTPTIGLVHRYDESMVLFEYRLRDHFPAIDLSYISQNVLSGDSASLLERREGVLAELGGLADAVLAANEFDLRFFSEVEARFDQLLASVPDVERRLEEFRERNLALQVQMS